jgi:hypothetical protein
LEKRGVKWNKRPEKMDMNINGELFGGRTSRR